MMSSMPVRLIAKHPSASRLVAMTRRLLDQSKLCAIATVSPGTRAHVNTAYFAWGPLFEIVWLSAPEARHSRNIRANPSAAVAVYRSTQTWGGSDRGIQLFGRARELRGGDARAAERLYAARFNAYDADLDAYRFYRLRPRRIKLFDEHVLGGATWVTVAVGAGGRLRWVRTESYV
ncbi:MAG: pyridoxamine 5'-phosphate oxidase family protein [Chloroflexi bacterium]|nr:MAG: pyridoxamine 5'-phosphate oxidase family protein [Chloroflexota bacterium]TMG57195.1 MAG: pyridoxamine 5'-phosphate oxidase family protein [Chloroflexota bacterium]